MERKEVIKILESIREKRQINNKKGLEALDYAISSVKTDEAYDLIYEGLEAEEVVHAKWILDGTDNSSTCSHCGCLLWANDILRGDAYYCPNCGAKMDGE